MFKKLCLMAALLIALSGSQTAAAADERFSVDINVDVTDINASAAREKAMNEANKAAVLAVVRRISTAEGVTRMSALNANQLITFIKEVSVIEEKSSPVRYIAQLRIVLNEDILKQYMKERDIPLLLAGGSKILVVPVFREFSSDPPLLWENANLWKQAWDAATNTSAVSFVSLPANAFNYAAIDAQKALALDGEALSKIINANNASDAYVLDASYDGIEGLIIHAASYNGDNQTIRVPGARSSGAELFNKAVAAVKQQLESKISAQNISENALENTMTVLFTFANLAEWSLAEKALADTPVVNKVDIQAFASNRAQLKLTYTGSETKLNRLLNTQGYTLRNQGNYHTLEKL